eukprot:GEMP01011408.1.p1 GENE.GEMP01011408.1~~GEMP01011408.1.p1  ORF type:complete len:379 (+),score=39.62 GEMP01011408.1:37-1173(+)
MMTDEEQDRCFTYNAEQILGNGSFGIVYQATVVETNDTVAIKKVFQDKRYKNRELDILRALGRHPNIIGLKHAFYTCGEKHDELYLNLVMEYMPETVYRVMRCYQKMQPREAIPSIFMKLYIYQVCRALAHMHAQNVVHRDIKPQNLLVDSSTTHALRLCDFGSAKLLTGGGGSVQYICSRYYRAPELIFGSSEYTCAIDMWSAGCALAEMVLKGTPMFPGSSGVDQLEEIVKVLGTPTREDIVALNSNYREDFAFPPIRPMSWRCLFHKDTDPVALDLLSKLLVYNPGKRIGPMQLLMHPFFDELRAERMTTASGISLPDLFNFTPSELSMCTDDMLKVLLPHGRSKLSWQKTKSGSRLNSKSQLYTNGGPNPIKAQ